VRPEQPEHGYVVRGVRHGCTREELIARCRASEPHVDVVWAPPFPRLLPPAEVPWLLEAVRQRTRENLRYNLKNGLALTLVWSAAALTLLLRDYPLPVLMIVVFMMGVIPTLQPAWGLWRLRKDPEGYTREQAGILRYQMWLGTRRAVVTTALVACLAVVFAAQHFVGVERSVAVAGLVKSGVRDGEVWRLLTCALLHGNWLHLALNGFALLALGRLVEMHGHPFYLPTVFLFSALSGSAASLYLTPATSVGASGGIMGVVGFLAVIGLRRRYVVPRGFLRSIAMSVALTAATGLVAHEYIDNAAHAGGLVGGLMLGAVYVTRHSGAGGQFRLEPSPLARVAGVISTAALAAAAAVTLWLLLKAA
jgi:membrane associated rhomboid family serine protease